MRFGDNFDWVRGGKLPGLCAGDCPTGCDKSIKPKDGFSARIMWTECVFSAFAVLSASAAAVGTVGLSKNGENCELFRAPFACICILMAKPNFQSLG